MYTKVRHALLVLAATAALAVGICPAKTALAEGEYVPGEVIVVYEESAAPVEQTDAELADRGYEVTQQSDTTPDEKATEPEQTDTIAVAETPEGVSVEQAVAEVSSLEGVAYAQPNYVYHAVEPASATGANVVEPAGATGADAVNLNDAYFKRALLKNLELSSVRNAWEMAQTNGKVTVAVLDTGCRITHEDLTENVNWLYAWDFLTNKDNGGQRLVESIENDANDYGDGNGHGTHVCGVVGAQANNNVGTAGSSYNAGIIPMRVLDASGNGSTSTVAAALRKVLELKNDKEDPVNIRVANLSLGGSGRDTTLNNLITQLANEGVLCVCAAGNESNTGDFTPADAPKALSVMATDKNGAHTHYTNYKTSGNINTSKTVSAMGGGGTTNDDWVWSAYKTSDKNYVGLSGTSQATPLVAGVVSLMFAANPSLTSDEARNILTSTTDEVNGKGTYAYKDPSSAGVVNAYKAVAAAQGAAIKSVDIPTPVEGLVYTGMPQMGVTAHVGYTLNTVPYDSESEQQSTTTSSANLHEGAKETNAGYYRTTVHLVTGYQWQDGSTTDKVVEWLIDKAPLTATYTGGSYQTGDHVSTDITVSGFVNEETAETAAGYVAPVLDLQGAVDANGKAQLPEGETSHVYEPTLTGGGADNYYFQVYDQEYITVTRLSPVHVPTASTGLTYTGKEQVGVPEGEDYTVEGGRQTNAGSYAATVKIKDPTTHSWEDGTVEDKVIEWNISPARLRLVYNGGKMMTSDNVADVAGSVLVTGFVNGESAATLAGFKTPGLLQVTSNVSQTGEDALSISAVDLSAAADPSMFKRLDTELVSTPGAKTLIPIVKGLAEVDPERAGNPTSNYEFFESQSGTLDVYGRATAPTKTDYTYDGQTKQGVRGGINCLITGTSAATAAGTYTAQATPIDHHIWSDKTLDDIIASRTYSWKINAASIAGAYVSDIGSVTYSGKAATPALTVRLGTQTLVNGSDYMVAYRNNINVGTATAVIVGRGNYRGNKIVSFQIVERASDSTQIPASAQTHVPAPTPAPSQAPAQAPDPTPTPENTTTPTPTPVPAPLPAPALENPSKQTTTPESEPTPEPDLTSEFVPTSSKSFSDVSTSAWYAGVVGRAAGLGLINGYKGGRFGPNDNITRGQVAVILWNMTGKPAPKGTPRSFPDVRSGKYYYDAIRWASSVAVVTGYDIGKFGPDDPVTREQLAVMLANYASKVAGKTTSGSTADYSGMKDAAKVSSWAAKSVGWCFRKKIFSGTKDGRVNPQGKATRAETAKMVVFLHDLL